MSKSKIFIGLAVTAAFAVGGSLPAAADTVGADSPIPGLVNSDGISGPAIASGVLSGVDSKSVAGALVVLNAWPSGEELSRLQIGETVKISPVGFAYADAQGRFELKISDRELSQKYRDGMGKIDFEINSVTQDTVFTHFFTADAGAVDAKVAGRTGLSISAVKDLAPRFKEPEFAPDGGAIEKACVTTKVANLGNFWVNVGYGYVSGSGATMKFTYTSGSSSELGVGVSTSGAAGTYSASGTSSFSSTSTVSYPSTNSFKAWKTQFRWGKYQKKCGRTGGGTVTTYTAKADGYAGGSSIQTIQSYPTATYCVSNAAGTSFTKASTAAYSSSVGASTSGVLGVNVTAKTGYTSTTKITFTFTATKLLCGTNGLPGGTPVRLVAR